MSKISVLFTKKTKTFFKKFRKFNALNNLDKKLLQYINYKNGFYIECGANDGVDQSNTWHFEKFKNWHGILIEAHPEIAECYKPEIYKALWSILWSLDKYNIRTLPRYILSRYLKKSLELADLVQLYRNYIDKLG